MEKLIESLKECNKVLAELNSTLGAIIQDLGRIVPLPIEGDERDNKNEDSNLEREQ